MKKIFSLILAAVLPMVANAYDIAVANDDGVTIYYNYINNGTELEVTSGNYSGSIVIPEEVTYMKRTRKITGIGNYAFYGCIGLTSVTISNSVTRIGDYAFWECDVPEIISRIENPFSISTNTFTDYTFNNATLYIPAGTKDKYKATEGWKKFIIIVDGNGAADGDILSGWSEEGYQFKMQVISEKEKTASLYGYYKTNYGGIPCIDDKITGVITIPAQSEGYKIIGVSNDAFAGCAKLTEVVLPEGIQTFGFDAFAGCYALEKIKIPSTVTDMYNSNIFRSCRSLKVIEVAEGNKYYDSRNNCNAIIKKDGNVLVTGCFNTIIPDGVVEIGNSAFSGQTNLHEISLPSSVKTLNENAFASTSLSSIDLSNIKTIGFGIFQNCKNLMEVKFGEELEVIGGYAFYNCTGLTSVTIPNSVTSIGDEAFCGCSGLTSLTIGNSVTNIGYQAFYYCSGLTSVTIPNSVTSIGSQAFSCCSSLTSVTIPKSVTSIGYQAFYGCDIPEVISKIENPFDINTNTFSDNTFYNATLYVPTGTIDKYKVTNGWKKFVFIEEEVLHQRCNIPTISYSNGKLIFKCETENVDFVSEITDTDIKKNYTATVNLTASYNISVYATKTNYENSDTIHATLCWIDVEPATEGIVDEDAVNEVKALPVLIQTQGGIISVQGAAEGTPIAIYDTSGKMYGSATSEKERTTISTSLQPGTVAVVKIGEKVVKVLVK